MRTLRIHKNSKSLELVEGIIEMEDMDVTIEFITDALGDSMMVISGDKEEIDILEDLFYMVYRVK